MYVITMICKTNKLSFNMNSLNKLPGYPVTYSQGYSANYCQNSKEKCNKDIILGGKKKKKEFSLAFFVELNYTYRSSLT